MHVKNTCFVHLGGLYYHSVGLSSERKEGGSVRLSEGVDIHKENATPATGQKLLGPCQISIEKSLQYQS